MDEPPQPASHAQDIGLPLPALLTLGVGLLILVLGGLFAQIVTTSDAPSQGLANSASWLAWIGSTTVGLSVAAGGLFATTARGGYRVAMVIFGLWIAVTGTRGAAAFSPFGFF